MTVSNKKLKWTIFYDDSYNCIEPIFLNYAKHIDQVIDIVRELVYEKTGNNIVEIWTNELPEYLEDRHVYFLNSSKLSRCKSIIDIACIKIDDRVLDFYAMRTEYILRQY